MNVNHNTLIKAIIKKNDCRTGWKKGTVVHPLGFYFLDNEIILICSRFHNDFHKLPTGSYSFNTDYTIKVIMPKDYADIEV